MTTKMDELKKIVLSDSVTRLRALAKQQHDDLSVADEAADEIERLRATIRLLESYMGCVDVSDKKSYAL